MIIIMEFNKLKLNPPTVLHFQLNYAVGYCHVIVSCVEITRRLSLGLSLFLCLCLDLHLLILISLGFIVKLFSLRFTWPSLLFFIFFFFASD